MGEEYQKLCSYENLLEAFKKAKKGRSSKSYVKECEKNLKENLLSLQAELLFHTYKPKPLQHFIIKEPKTRKISKSAFPDRIVHHAVCNILEPLYEKIFIYDSYANRKGRGTLKSIERFDYFKRKVSRNNKVNSYILKADIKKYFENVDHKTLLLLLKKRVQDEQILWLIERILNNYTSSKEGKGMPLGNLTSQFFANVYLHELDHFVKQKLRIKYYIRYVDDFIIAHKNKECLENTKETIEIFLKEHLQLELHPEKSKVFLAKKGVNFLGFKIFYYHKLVKKANLRRFIKKKEEYYKKYKEKIIEYDSIYNFMEGWDAYAQHANTYRMRTRIKQELEDHFYSEISQKEVNRHLKLFTKMMSENRS